MLTHTKAEDAHVLYMAPLLRRADCEEIAAYSGLSPLEGLSKSKAVSHLSYTIMADGEPIAMYGGTAEGYGKANVWMLGTAKIEDNSRQFLRLSRSHLDDFQKELNSSFIYAIADPRNTLHQLWLLYTGFKLGKLLEVRGNNFITVTRLTCV